MRRGPAAPDVDRADGARRRENHSHSAQPAVAGLLDMPYPDPGDVCDGSRCSHGSIVRPR